LGGKLHEGESVIVRHGIHLRECGGIEEKNRQEHKKKTTGESTQHGETSSVVFLPFKGSLETVIQNPG
jgi:hypothetical protein